MAPRTKPQQTFVTRAEAEALANAPAPSPDFALYPPVLVHLYCTAPGCADLPSDHPDVWRWIYNLSPERVLRRLLTRLERAPTLIEVTEWQRGWTDVLGSHPEVTDREFIPLATITEGLSFDQVNEAHQSLIDSGWKPERKAA